jgi:Rrf2 family protein
MRPMRMTLHTDHALRMPICVAPWPDGVCTMNDVAEAYGLSRNHILKVAQTLRDLGLKETTRGRVGGIALAKAPTEIAVGTLVRATEEYAGSAITPASWSSFSLAFTSRCKVLSCRQNPRYHRDEGHGTEPVSSSPTKTA